MEQIQKAVGGVGIDVTLDCVGFSKTMSTALSATRSGGKVCLVGMGHCDMTIPLTPAAARLVFIWISVLLEKCLYWNISNMFSKVTFV
mgnify:CR=1 FL=1